jgi:hypothetical protein
MAVVAFAAGGHQSAGLRPFRPVTAKAALVVTGSAARMGRI